MSLDVLTIKLLFLFFPGIICAYIVDKLTVHEPRNEFHFMLRSFVFGLSSYFLYWIAIKAINQFVNSSLEVVFLNSLASGMPDISCREIFWVTVLAVILGLIITVESTYKLFMKVVQRIKITRKFGDIDVWGFVFNSKQSNDIEWVTVRDLNHDLVYDGWFEAFSDNSRDMELLLRDVSVYKNSTGDFLYQVGAMYISKHREDIVIEFRGVPVNDEYKVQTKGGDKNGG